MTFEFRWPNNIVEWITSAVGVFFFTLGVIQFFRWILKKRQKSDS